LRNASIAPSCLSVCPSFRQLTWNNSAPIWRIFMKFDMYFMKVFRENWSFIKICQQLWVLYMKSCLLLWSYLWVNLPRIRIVSDKNCRENQKTHFIFIIFFPPENHAIYEIMWQNVVEPDRPHNIARRMHVACWITKAAHALRVCNAYWFSTATVVTRKHLSVTFIRILPVLLKPPAVLLPLTYKHYIFRRNSKYFRRW